MEASKFKSKFTEFEFMRTKSNCKIRCDQNILALFIEIYEHYVNIRILIFLVGIFPLNVGQVKTKCVRATALRTSSCKWIGFSKADSITSNKFQCDMNAPEPLILFVSSNYLAWFEWLIIVKAIIDVTKQYVKSCAICVLYIEIPISHTLDFMALAGIIERRI